MLEIQALPKGVWRSLPPALFSPLEETSVATSWVDFQRHSVQLSVQVISCMHIHMPPFLNRIFASYTQQLASFISWYLLFCSSQLIKSFFVLFPAVSYSIMNKSVIYLISSHSVDIDLACFHSFANTYNATVNNFVPMWFLRKGGYICGINSHSWKCWVTGYMHL